MKRVIDLKLPIGSLVVPFCGLYLDSFLKELLSGLCVMPSFLTDSGNAQLCERRSFQYRASPDCHACTFPLRVHVPK